LLLARCRFESDQGDHVHYVTSWAVNVNSYVYGFDKQYWQYNRGA
jgi:hypothetical protein